MVVLPLILASEPASRDAVTPSRGILNCISGFLKSLLTSASGCYPVAEQSNCFHYTIKSSKTLQTEEKVQRDISD